MEQTAKTSNGRRLIQFGLLALILIGLPLGSYVYLKRGYDYQVAAMHDLRKDVSMPTLADWEVVYGEWPDTLFGNMYLVGWLADPDNADATATYGQALERLHDQFDIPTNIGILTLLPRADSNWVANFIDTYHLRDPAQVYFLSAGGEAFGQSTQSFGLTEEHRSTLATDPPLAIVDDSLYVRIAYRVTREEELKRLVEQTAILLPERTRKKPELRRTPEK